MDRGDFDALARQCLVERVDLGGIGEDSLRQRYQPHRRRWYGREPFKRDTERVGDLVLAVGHQVSEPGYGFPAAQYFPVRQAVRCRQPAGVVPRARAVERRRVPVLKLPAEHGWRHRGIGPGPQDGAAAGSVRPLVQVADPVIGPGRGDVVAQLARPVRGVDQHRSSRPRDGRHHRGDGDDGSGRRGDPVDDDQPRAG